MPSTLLAHAPARPAVLNEDCFRRIRAIIYEHAGIYFSDSKLYLLESRVMRRLHVLGLDDFPAYARLVEGGALEEIAELAQAVTINETFFFRNIPQLDVLEHHVLPRLVHDRMKQGIRQINLWSAGCSSGEEPYSLALLIREKMQPRYPRMTFRIVGSDISHRMLEAARRGVYKEYAVRHVPKDCLKSCFLHSDEGYRLRPDVCGMVEFTHLNLYDGAAMRAMRGFDVVVCANTLIYFDQRSKQRVLDRLYESLNPDGVLFLGFSESLQGLTEAFRPTYYDKTLAFTKALPST